MYTKVYWVVYLTGTGTWLYVDYVDRGVLVRAISNVTYRRISEAVNQRAAAGRGKITATRVLPGWAYWEYANDDQS